MHASAYNIGEIGEIRCALFKPRKPRLGLSEPTGSPAVSTWVRRSVHGRPVVVIARTSKGKGVSFMEDASQWHGGIPSKEQFEIALTELQDGAKQWQA